MKKLLLTGVAALFLATGTAHAEAESDEVLAERCMNGATYWCEILDERIEGRAAAEARRKAARAAKKTDCSQGTKCYADGWANYCTRMGGISSPKGCDASDMTPVIPLAT
jgi:hypothetical protein